MGDNRRGAEAHLDGERDLVGASRGRGEEAGAHVCVAQRLCGLQGGQVLEVGVLDGPVDELAALQRPLLVKQRLVALLPGQDVVPPAQFSL